MKNSPLILQNIRVRGLGDVVESTWVETGKETTFFSLPSDFNRRGFLRALQAVSPPYLCSEQQPFKHYPLISRQGKFKKRVRPHRRTISFAIFVAQPQMVEELAAFTPHLYEADRIEVGRRLDCSRWVNFVEVAGSTRWIEIEDRIGALVDKHGASLDTALQKTLTSLSGSDRITGDLMEALAEWLHILAEEGREEHEKISQLLFAVERQHHFRKAKKFLRQRLPIFYLIDGRQLKNRKSHPTEKNLFSAVKKTIDSLLLQEKERNAPAPILLFDEPDLGLGKDIRDDLRQHVAAIGRKCQCLYLANEEHKGEPPVGARCITGVRIQKPEARGQNS